MNWLDPDAVREWLREHKRQREVRPDEWRTDMEWSMEQFVRGIAGDRSPPLADAAWCAKKWADYRQIARILVEAMGGDK